jgi:hypothetical protein
MLKSFMIFSVIGVSLTSIVPVTVTATPLEHIFTPGELIQKHAEYEDKCKLCHQHFEKASQRRLCLDCHKKINKDITDGFGSHGRNKKILETDCRHCHTDHKGRGFDIVRLYKDMFNHALTDFPLKDSHRNVICSGCHLKKVKYRDTPSRCIDCHKDNDLHKGRLEEVCSDCHQESKWGHTRYNHDKTKFPLKDKHQKVGCQGCHPGERYKKTPLDCNACHKLNDVHGGRYSTACQVCHNAKDWKKSIFAHDETKPVGNIKISDCYNCHKTDDVHKDLYGKGCEVCHNTKDWKKFVFDHDKIKSVGKIEISACYSCHKTDDFHDSRYGKKCDKCHNKKDWKKSIFDHDKTKFPLKERHIKVQCDICHPGKMYEDKLDTTCYACHKENDEHRGRYTDKCEKCHTPKDWKRSTLDHDKTEYPLKDKHAKVPCDACHKLQLYRQKLGTACYSCHEYDDVHNGRYSKVCSPCHTVKEWKRSIFDHEKTVFPRKDNIAAPMTDCGKCYQERLGMSCYDCHKYDDAHKNNEGPLCESCHNVQSWVKEVFFDHDITKFPLIGLHAVTPCEECHLEATYKDTSTDCLNCHKDDDIHQLSLGSKCSFCHNPNGWGLWLFDHNTQSGFALDGAHAGVECKSCHSTPVKGKIRLLKNCYSCHMSESIHRGRFWKNCGRCHVTESFKEIRSLH